MKTTVLDIGFVDEVEQMGSDLTVVNAAKVSFGNRSEWEWSGSPYMSTATRSLAAKDARLIQFLARGMTKSEHDDLLEEARLSVDAIDNAALAECFERYRDTATHWTPFGHCVATFHVKWPIFVARQAMRSNVGFVWNEISRRYVTSEPEFYVPEVWRRAPRGSIKQGSGEPMGADAQASEDKYLGVLHRSLSAYDTMIEDGVAPEQARMVLPVSVYTECWVTASLAAWARFCKLRQGTHAQSEIQQYAKAISYRCSEYWPVSWSALMGGE